MTEQQPASGDSQPEAPSVPRRIDAPVPRDAAAGDDATYSLTEHAEAAAAGAYGPDVRPEHVAAAAVGCFPGQERLTRAEMLEALDDLSRMPINDAGGAPAPEQQSEEVSRAG